mgnify:CR=1 FL=1
MQQLGRGGSGGGGGGGGERFNKGERGISINVHLHSSSSSSRSNSMQLLIDIACHTMYVLTLISISHTTRSCLCAFTDTRAHCDRMATMAVVVE